MTSAEFEQLFDVVAEMREVLGTGLTFGYIGNVWQAPYVDDRAWYVWFDDFPRGIQNEWLNNKPSVAVGCVKYGYLDAQQLRVNLIKTFYRMRAIIEGRQEVTGFRYALVPR